MLFTIAFTVFIISSTAFAADCNPKCPPVPKHYEEFGCTPIVKSGECCPSSFDCSSLKSRDANKCYYKSKLFNIGEELVDKDVEASCTIACSCSQRDPDLPAKFNCAHIDCPEFFGRPSVPGKKCILQYEEKGCCSSNEVCGEEIEKLAKCEFNGKTYYEGQRIDTERSCYSCLCQKGFENKPYAENKHCHKINCNIEVHYSAKIDAGCIPIFYKTEECCPIMWRCPKDSDTVVVDKSRKNLDSDLKCSFGKLEMNVGDFLSPEDDQCTTCSCKLPPNPHCIKTC